MEGADLFSIRRKPRHHKTLQTYRVQIMLHFKSKRGSFTVDILHTLCAHNRPALLHVHTHTHTHTHTHPSISISFTLHMLELEFCTVIVHFCPSSYHPPHFSLSIMLCTKLFHVLLTFSLSPRSPILAFFRSPVHPCADTILISNIPPPFPSFPPLKFYTRLNRAFAQCVVLTLPRPW